MDFFTAVDSDKVSLRDHPVDPFAQAVASRFGSPPIFTAHLSPTNHSPNSPMEIMSFPSKCSPQPTSSSSSSFPPLAARSLHEWLDDPSTLIVDIRPHAAYSSARIPGALCLSVPSTLLKRPLFSLERLAAMLPSSSTRNRFSAWHSASRILVYDADSAAIPDSSNIQGLLRKFKNDGFRGELAWLQGGFQGVWRERRDLVNTRPPTPEAESEEDGEDTNQPHQTSLLRTRNLPMSAFSLSSTIIRNSPHLGQKNTSRPHTSQHICPPPSISSHAYSRPACNPFFDTIRQNLELSHGITECIPLRLPRRVRRRIHELPFPWLQNIAHRAGKAVNIPSSQSDLLSSDSDDDSPDSANVEEGAEALAMQFYRIELAEQRRLMGIMEHHSKESGEVPVPGAKLSFPFSITAGVEKGAKNRYRHIWPFEHARVRLHQRRPSDDDYVNASYVQPLGTNRRYIATQGPLPATFVDFWTLCWEQNVHVIVMLTREVEGAMVKCGSYWTENAFGPLRLRLISTSGLMPEDDQPGFFANPSTSSIFTPDSSRIQGEHRYKSETIKRVFELVHTGHPAAKPRTVVHLQYLEWPDMNVPDDPRGVLGLIKQVQEAVEETNIQDEPSVQSKNVDMSTIELDETVGIAKHALGKNSPVLLHCSAGVGRTGGFIAVDAVLDAIRREIRTTFRAHRGGEAMDVDLSISESAIVEENGTSHSSMATIPIAVTSGHPLSSTQLDGSAKEGKGSLTISSGLAVHVPVASAILHPRELQYENSVLAADTCTRKWVENVAQYGRPVATGSSSSEGSEGLQHAHGSYHHPSSSLDTSVSGTSSPSKSLFPPAGIQSISTTLPDHLPTFSKRCEDHSRNVPVNVTSLASTSRVFKPATGGQSMPNLLGKLSDTLPVPIDHHFASDAELPSRSQSPSADEESRQHDGRQLQSSHPRPMDSACTAPFTSPSTNDSEHKSFDYKEPRPLHEDDSPLALTSFDDPIWEVVQDMREQRMSLCQSLRQYVFVHAAVIEGALMVLDQEKESMVPANANLPPPKIQEASTLTSQSVHVSEDAFMASSVSIGKRGASPTELLKEGKTGEVLEPKRPSIKRKHRSKDASDNLRYPSMPIRSISHVVHHGTMSVKTFPP
ncbi:uncharacterized protein LACBIDRAFT_300875 [Laccaria bicolor S238N-H82]|uniref:protein-tyrosine-phosphatase n=1 Tax=Laccaria bicolor (strain S238N-H82 / ATCC MYA-4686) TaxID=486041 RepID=B0CQS4_LACBS|nr:uncharacterized protein LACBIDRAFT_300875 [Laccaria bicolor S238N-H82]EDR15085.1 predicted protein [Laccaria bicolor S238N-H82]|eukprot:XP_001873293.1 predicted protein [Laccaria bicolor S238N-H82]